MQYLARCMLLVVIAATTSPAQKIRVEYDKNVDFTKFKSFKWGERDSSSRPILAYAILGAIEEELTKRGLHRTDAEPDLYVQVYGSVDSDMGVSTSDVLYSGMGGIPPFDRSFVMWGSVPGSTSTVVVYKGQLVVDIIDASQKKIAWRGVAEEKLSEKKEKLINQVNTAVEKMFKQYPTVQK